MKRIIRRCSISRSRGSTILACLTLLSVATQVARAHDVEPVEGDWEYVLNLAAGGGVDEAHVNRAAFEDDRNFTYGMIHLDGRILTPRQLDLPAAPRFFLRASVAQKFGDDVGMDLRNFDDASDVRRSLGKVDNGGVIWDVGLGVSLPFTWKGRSFRLEPSLAYGQENVEARSRLDDTDTGRLRGGSDIRMHFVKQMMELTTPVARFENLRVDGFVGAFVQHFFKRSIDNERALQSAGSFDYDKSVGVAAFLGVRFTVGRRIGAS